jgi:hypothetical protein
MPKRRLRKIIVDGEPYFWKFNPTYEKDENLEWRCHDIFVAYTISDKNYPLKIHFITWESPVSGGPLRTGAPTNLDDPKTGGINLHQPKFAALLIKQGLLRGWNPIQKRALVIEDGIGLLKEIGYSLE